MARKQQISIIIWPFLAYLVLASQGRYCASSHSEECRHQAEKPKFEPQNSTADFQNVVSTPPSTASVSWEQLKLDAFNSTLCGIANFRPWQMNESAFGGCKVPAGALKGNRSSSSLLSVEGEDELDKRNNQQASGRGDRDLLVEPRILNGEAAIEGEFPFNVHLEVRLSLLKWATCGGILIHKNLVITAAHCVSRASSIKLFFGSNSISGPVARKAHKWCIPSEFKDFPCGNGPCYDITVIRLKDPIDYVPYKVGPACLRPNQRHLDESSCALAGFGLTGSIDWNNSKIIKGDATKVLQTLKLKRKSTMRNFKNDQLEYYVASDINQFGYEGDSGGPLVCYDRCGGIFEGEQNKNSRFRAFVVGAHVSGDERDAVKQKRFTKNFFMDFFKMRDYLPKLIYETQRDKDGNVTLNNNKDFKCTYA